MHILSHWLAPPSTQPLTAESMRVYATALTYSCSFIKFQLGSGSIISDKGWTYEGGILRSMRDGEGVCSWPELGMRYQGEWKNDRRSGQGKSIIDHDGQYAVYEGMWEDDMRSGQGEMFWSCGASYSGEWKQDHPHGRGQAIFSPDGIKFEGEFDPGPRKLGSKGVEVPGGVPSGRGRLEFPWGDVYVGEVLNGRPQGIGKLMTSNGDYVDGHFDDGFPGSKCTGRRSYDDSVYTGDLQGWTPSGLGRLSFPESNSFYSGPFVDGEPSGKGKFVKVETDERGEHHEVVVYDGAFKNGRPLTAEPHDWWPMRN